MRHCGLREDGREQPEREDDICISTNNLNWVNIHQLEAAHIRACQHDRECSIICICSRSITLWWSIDILCLFSSSHNIILLKKRKYYILKLLHLVTMCKMPLKLMLTFWQIFPLVTNTTNSKTTQSFDQKALNCNIRIVNIWDWDHFSQLLTFSHRISNFSSFSSWEIKV